MKLLRCVAPRAESVVDLTIAAKMLKDEWLIVATNVEAQTAPQ
jgi:hypothetical protein